MRKVYAARYRRTLFSSIVHVRCSCSAGMPWRRMVTCSWCCVSQSRIVFACAHWTMWRCMFDGPLNLPCGDAHAQAAPQARQIACRPSASPGVRRGYTNIAISSFSSSVRRRAGGVWRQGVARMCFCMSATARLGSSGGGRHLRGRASWPRRGDRGGPSRRRRKEKGCGRGRLSRSKQPGQRHWPRRSAAPHEWRRHRRERRGRAPEGRGGRLNM